MRRIVGCPLCGSDVWAGRRCEQPTCLGRSDEQVALDDARHAFATGAIEIGELEARVAVALTGPPRVHRSRHIYR